MDCRASGNAHGGAGAAFLQTGTPTRPHALLLRRAGGSRRAWPEPPRPSRPAQRIIGGHWISRRSSAPSRWPTKSGPTTSPRRAERLTRKSPRNAGRTHHPSRHEHLHRPHHSGGRLNARTTEPLVESSSSMGRPGCATNQCHPSRSSGRPTPMPETSAWRAKGLIGEVLSLARPRKTTAARHRAGERGGCAAGSKPSACPALLVDHVVTSGGVMHDQTFWRGLQRRFRRHECQRL